MTLFALHLLSHTVAIGNLQKIWQHKVSIFYYNMLLRMNLSLSLRLIRTLSFSLNLSPKYTISLSYSRTLLSPFLCVQNHPSVYLFPWRSVNCSSTTCLCDFDAFFNAFFNAFFEAISMRFSGNFDAFFNTFFRGNFDAFFIAFFRGNFDAF